MRRPIVLAGLLLLAAVVMASTANARATRTISVGPGQSIQAAVDLASPGDTILVQPGTYTETGRPCPAEPTVSCAVVVNKDNINLVAQGSAGHPVILQSTGSQDQGFAVAKWWFDLSL
jgi:hypothetical protein